MKKKQNRNSNNDLKVGLLGMCLFVTGWAIATRGISPLEESLFRLLNDLPDFLRPVLSIISFAGTLLFVVIAAVFTTLKKNYRVSCKFLVVGILSSLSVIWLKTFETRLRPPLVLSDVHLRAQLDTIVGYPSGHAAIAAALGLITYRYTKKKYHRYIVISVVLVCLSRLYLGMHFPVDVVGGVGVGLFIASAMNYLFAKPRNIKY